MGMQKLVGSILTAALTPHSNGAFPDSTGHAEPRAPDTATLAPRLRLSVRPKAGSGMVGAEIG